MLYWAGTCAIYVLAELLIWLLVDAGAVSGPAAGRLGLILPIGVGFFYVLVRFSGQLGLGPSFLTVLQGVFATIAIVASYAIAEQFRGATLSILVVMMSFCGFALSVRQSIALSTFSMLALGGTMVWLSRIDPQGHPPVLELAHFVLASGMLVAVVFLTAQWNRLRDRLKSQRLELANAFEKIQLLASNDDLTRLPNRRHMNAVLSQEERRSDRLVRSVCLALLDIDHFKKINDTYGHAAGDEVLKGFATHLRGTLRSEDVLARWGGEEFLLLLPHTTEESALQVLLRIQSRLGSIAIDGEVGSLVITFSGGLTAIRSEERIADAIKRADLAMFQAKSDGRNTIRSYAAEKRESSNLDSSIS
jgi:diguanylate cyclase (GGDEF)-like protein